MRCKVCLAAARMALARTKWADTACVAGSKFIATQGGLLLSARGSR